MMHAHGNLREYGCNEIQTIHPRLFTWLQKTFPGLELESLTAQVSSCDDGNCPVTATVLKFRAQGSELQLRLGRVLNQVSQLDFSLAAEKQFPHR